MGRTLHMCVDKMYLIRVMREDDAKGLDWRRWLVDIAETVTLDDAVAELMADPRTVLSSCDCIKNADGSCSGVKEGES